MKKFILAIFLILFAFVAGQYKNFIPSTFIAPTAFAAPTTFVLPTTSVDAINAMSAANQNAALAEALAQEALKAQAAKAAQESQLAAVDAEKLRANQLAAKEINQAFENTFAHQKAINQQNAINFANVDAASFNAALAAQAAQAAESALKNQQLQSALGADLAASNLNAASALNQVSQEALLFNPFLSLSTVPINVFYK